MEETLDPYGTIQIKSSKGSSGSKTITDTNGKLFQVDAHNRACAATIIVIFARMNG